MRFYSRLDDTQCQRLHEATLRVPGTARLSDDLVHWALKVAPKEVTLYGRDGQPALRCGGYEYSFGAGSDCVNCFDHRTGERRRAVLATSSKRRASRKPARTSIS